MNDYTAALLNLDLEDRARTEECIGNLSVTDRAAADKAEATIMARLGTFPAVGTDGPNSDLAWLTAFVRTAERVAEWHASLGVPADITAASLGDVGRHLRLHKRVHGNFGLETWWWLINHFEGALFQLGRLQFLLREVREGEPRQPHGGGWCLDVHIPDSGPLLPSLVDNSFAQAASFFPHHFPSHFPTGQCTRAVCFSWLLDPYLAEALPASSNIVRFQQEFTRCGTPQEATADVRYFLFRTRSADPACLVAETRLQQIFLDRISAGGIWFSCHGWRPLEIG
jgi:hypothetical protein